MARRRAAERRVIQPDSRFNSLVFAKFINCLMWEGKKSIAQRIFYDAVQKLGDQGEEIVLRAINNVKPSVEVRSRRVGGATYQVPSPVSAHRSLALGLRWIIDASRNRSEKTMEERLAAELSGAAEKNGAAFKKCVDTHKMAAANQAFAHYRW